MVIYTNTGLVKHAEAALKLKTIYMWGGILRLVEKQYDLLKKYYGNKSGTGYSDARWAKLKGLFGKNYFGCDCVGLIKSYYWSGKADGGTGSPNYGAAGYPDVNANYMYQMSKVKGKISTMPEIPGLVVYSKSHPHVGIYIGGGETIESTLGSRGDGVVKRKLDNFWEYWFQCPYIEYPKDSAKKAEPAAVLAIGDKVTIKDTATSYAGVSKQIPQTYKGSSKIYTVSKVMSDRVLLKELYSWVFIRDLVKK